MFIHPGLSTVATDACKQNVPGYLPNRALTCVCVWEGVRQQVDIIQEMSNGQWKVRLVAGAHSVHGVYSLHDVQGVCSTLTVFSMSWVPLLLRVCVPHFVWLKMSTCVAASCLCLLVGLLL